MEDIETRIGFASLSLSRQQILPSGNEGLTWFGTATVYRDFADPSQANFFVTGAANPLSSTNDTLGTYGEASIGVNYTRIMDSGSALPARQLNANVRLDSRFSEQLDSWGVTAQLRLQF